MKLRCLGSSSDGNCWLLESATECLILDAGIPIKSVKKALDYDISKIACVCVTHEHKDHSLAVKDFEHMGIPVFKPYEEPDEHHMGFSDTFTVTPFDCKHNVPCYGFYITHPEMGALVYAVDTMYIKYHFKDVEHFLVECNWSKDCADTEAAKYEHELRDHMEQETCMEFLRANKSDSLKTVILCHMSASAIDGSVALEKAREVAGNGVYVACAEPGLTVELESADKCPFM